MTRVLPIFVALATPALVRADTAAVQITWTAPAGCPDVAYVSAEVERLLGRPLAAREHRPLLVHARVSREPSGAWWVDLLTTGEGVIGQRRLEADDCLAIADAVALIVTMAINQQLEAAKVAVSE